jgi:Fic family protein
MEFSDDFNTFQIKSFNQGVMDFSTDYASLTFRRRRRSNSVRTNSFSQQTSTKITSIMRRVTCLVVGAIVLFVALSLSNVIKNTSELSDMNYLTMWEEGDLSSFTMVASKGNKDQQSEDVSSNAEAINSLNAALEMKKLHKNLKAKKLFLHALALAPHNPRTLFHYGLFLEEHSDSEGHGLDLVEADHQYARAVAFSNSDLHIQNEAVAARKRTASKVEVIDDQVLQRIDKKKLHFLDIRADSAALKRAKKEAYFQYIYHTVGIEGNTMNLAQTRSVLETKLAVAGKSVMEHNEILGMDSALKYINNTLVDKIGDITLQDILEMHRRVIGNVDPVEAGLFRRTQVYVGDHVPPPPSQVYSMVNKFVSWLNSIPAMSLHPVRLAALAHYKLVHIHPFVDGNGRTSRLLMNLVLMQSGFPPVIIRRADRDIYYNHLVTANEGDIRPFIRFIAHCTEKTLDAYLWASQEFISMGELDSVELPHNLVEHTTEQVNTDVWKYREMRESAGNWLNLSRRTIKSYWRRS